MLCHFVCPLLHHDQWEAPSALQGVGLLYREQCMDMIKREEYEYTPRQGFVLTHFQTVQDVERSSEFYLRVLGGKVIRSGEPTIIQIANSWLVLNVGGGPTDDKPSITLHTPQNQNEANNFMNIRVADIWAS